MQSLIRTLLGMACIATSSCVMYGDVRVLGRQHDVTMADIRAAIDADYKPHGTPSEIRVVNKDEIWLYYNPRDKPQIDIGHRSLNALQVNGSITLRSLSPNEV
jgi:hypothetical protein